MDELLDVEQVKAERKARGVTAKWLIEHLGMSESSGYLMLRKGLLPEEPKRKVILEKLAKFLGREVTQLLLRPTRPRKLA